jgi:hypothetical protein
MNTPYKQMSYYEITEENYNELISQITKPDFSENINMETGQVKDIVQLIFVIYLTR